MSVTELVNEIFQMNRGNLEHVTQAVKRRWREITAREAMQWMKGQSAILETSKGEEVAVKIKKVNRITVNVTEIDGHREWQVSPVFLKPNS